jgi:predicted 3-demethylubiquinone-9 3-methyltransferase (glyoxalase superfamily)
MSISKQLISNCLWFDSEAEQAAKFYVSILPNSRIIGTSQYGEEGFEYHHRPAGSVMTVWFVLDGQEFMGLNGGPLYKFNESISLMIYCKDQEEINHFWNKLTEGGQENVCGWLKDKFGLSWQVIWSEWGRLMVDKEKSKRLMNTLFTMRRPIIEEFEKAINGL